MTSYAAPPSVDSAAESESLTRIARRVSGAGVDSATSLEMLASGAVTLLAAEGAVAALIEGSTFRIVAAAGSLVPLDGFHAPLAASLATEAIDRGSPVIVNDAARDGRVEAHFLAPFGPQQVAVASMTAEHSARGFLLAINSARGSFTSADGTLLQWLADQGAIVMRQAERVEQLQEAAERSRALCDVALEISQTLELERVQALLAHHAAEMLHARGARVLLLEAGHLTVTATFGDVMDAVGTAVDPSRVFAGQALRLDRPQRTSDIRGFTHEWTRPLGRAGVGRPHAIVAPLLVGGRAIGAVTVIGNDERDFTEEDERLLLALAHQAAVATENSRLYRAAAYTTRHANALAASARALAFSATPEAVYAGVSAVAHDELGAEGFTVLLADADGGPLTLAHAEGAGKAIRWTSERFWRVVPGQVAASGVPQYVASMESVYAELTPEEAAAFQAASVRSVALLPLHTEGGQRGILMLGFTQTRRFDEHERHLMEDFATQVTLAIRNAQLIAAERTGRERERLLADTMHQTEKLAALGELVAGVAHELNNPLTGISTFAQLLLDETLAEEQREAVLTIKREADRAGSVIRDLLAFSRKTGPRDVMVDLNLLVQHTLRMRGYALQTAGIRVDTVLDPALPQISGDDQKLQQVLLNLVVNAEHAMYRQRPES